TAAGRGSAHDARAPGRRAPFMVASAILDERADADTLTPAQLVEAMADRGVTISHSTAQPLPRELPPPQRAARPGPARRAPLPPPDPDVEPPAHPGAPADRHRQRRPRCRPSPVAPLRPRRPRPAGCFWHGPCVARM